MKRLIFVCAIGLSGCAGLVDFINAIPPPTPDEQCALSGGKWRSVTTYDGNGNETGQSGECVSP
jgi:hypothetical protein